MSQLTSIWRHPIKSHGREALDAVQLVAGESMPWDRVWAVAHDAAKATGTAWAPCANFSRVAKAPGLMAITATLDEARETVTLRHPNRPDLTVRPDEDAEALIAWTTPLVPQDRALPDRVLRLDRRGWTDSPFASISLGNLASHRALEAHMGRELSIHRWRNNLWLDGLEPWEEFDWVGRELAIGDAILRVREPTERCLATTSNPETGQRDADTLAGLNHFGHQNFCVYAEVIQSGPIALGDTMRVL